MALRFVVLQTTVTGSVTSVSAVVPTGFSIMRLTADYANLPGTSTWMEFVLEVDNGAGFEFHTGCRWTGGARLNRATGLPTTEMPDTEFDIAPLVGKTVRAVIKAEVPTVCGIVGEVF